MFMIKILFAVHLKRSSFWPSAVVEPISNDPVQAMHWQCMLALNVYTGNTKGGNITVPLTSCLTGLESAV
jgi:hypothetical protein